MLILYYDKKAGWPVEIKYIFTSGDELVLTLTKTNVPRTKNSKPSNQTPLITIDNNTTNSPYK